MSFMDPSILWVMLPALAVGLGLLYWETNFKTKEEREYDRYLDESMKDEYITDPETGAKLTLEQAESGHWIAHDNEFRTKPAKELSKLTELERGIEIGVNYLRESKDYRNQELTHELELELKRTHIISSYREWTYYCFYRMEYFDGYVMIPNVLIESQYGYFNDSYPETQVLFWLKLNADFGHYHLRKQKEVDKVVGFFTGEKEIKIDGYTVETFRVSPNVLNVIRLLQVIEGTSGLRIELKDDSLLLKNTKWANLEEILRLEKLVKQLVSKLA